MSTSFHRVALLAALACGCGGDGGGGGGDDEVDSAVSGGDGGGGGDGDASAGDASGGIDAYRPPGSPAAGAHGLAYFRFESHIEVLSTPAMSTAEGSTIVVSVGRGNAGAFVAPTDNRGNGAYPQLGIVHRYTNWPGSGTALYARTGASGGAGHVVHVGTPYDDEITMAAVEVIGGTRIADVAWREVLAPAPLTSASVTTTGPATLVAFWWGDAGAEGQKTAVPGDGFVRVDAILDEGSLVQAAAAVRDVSAAGTYTVTWTATPVQGAQLWLVAVD